MTAIASAGARPEPVPARPEPRPLRRNVDLGTGVMVVLGGTLVLFLAIPLIALLGRALASGEIRDAISSPAVTAALALSLITTTVSLVLIVVLGTALAFLLARGRLPGSTLIEAIVDLPIVLPPSVAGLALLLAFGRRGAFGPSLEVLGLSIPFTTLAVILAQLFVAAPFFVRAARAGFTSIDRDVEDAARVDGASNTALLRHITMPLAAPALGAGIVLSWARALGEFGATIMFAGNLAGRTQTLPLVVYSEFQLSLDSSIAAAAVLLVAAGAVLVAVRLTHWRSAMEYRLA